MHGGTTEDDIIRKVAVAQELAQQNQELLNGFMQKYNSDQVSFISKTTSMLTMKKHLLDC